jgi:hypothetical protein
MSLLGELAHQAPIMPLHDLREARTIVGKMRAAFGLNAAPTPLLTPPASNVKFAKSKGVSVYGLSLAPALSSGITNVCPFSTPECRAHCVAHSGRGAYPHVPRGRAFRTKLLVERPDVFVTLLAHEISAAQDKHGAELRVRLNGFSDLPWERYVPWLFERDVKFYDYTKWPLGTRLTPTNYKLTYSASERWTVGHYAQHRIHGLNVAAVFDVRRGHPLPKTFYDVPVIDGDTSDDRWADPTPCVVGLRAKGSLRSAVSKFKQEEAA